jgi:hypothetical protein
MPAGRGEHLVALLTQEGLHDRKVIDFVVDYQNGVHMFLI